MKTLKQIFGQFDSIYLSIASRWGVAEFGKFAILFALVAAGFAYIEFHLRQYLSLDTLQQRQSDFNVYFDANSYRALASLEKFHAWRRG